MRRKNAEASVTVLFSFIIFLLLSLVLVSVESARMQAAASMLQTNVSMAMSSLGGRYYAPLFDEYGIYGLYQEDLTDSFLRYFNGTADPISNLPDDYFGERKSGYSFACYNPVVSWEQKLALTDGGGELMRRQMVEAGMVSGAEELIKKLLDTIGLLKEEEEAIRLLEEKARVEEKLTAMDCLLLKLIPLLDGIPTNVTGILCDEDGRVHPEKAFAKKLMVTEPTREAVGIDSFAMYYYLQPEYCNVMELIQDMQSLTEAVLQEENAGGTRTELEKKAEKLYLLITDTARKTGEAQEVIAKMRTLQLELIPLLNRYEGLLAESGTLLDGAWRETLCESVQTMKTYAGVLSGYYDLHAMQTRLTANRKLLTDAQDLAYEALVTIRYSKPDAELPGRIREALSGFSVEGLSIHYTGMHRGTSVKSSLLEGIKNFFAEGLTSGIMDYSNVSMNVLRAGNLPSKQIPTTAFDMFRIKLPGDIEDYTANSVWSAIANMRLSELAGMLREGMEELVEKVMVTAYAGEFFTDYSDENSRGGLRYQLEYLLFGKSSDMDNLSAAALRILGIRVLMNMIHTITAPTKRAQALTTATELTGGALPFLTKGIQYVILLAWGLQNAKLEAAEIMKGKQVPFLVTASSFQISYGEILSMNKTKRLERAEQYRSGNGVAPDYETYLLVFLLLADEKNVVYRSMDLIQQQMQLYYDPQFLMSSCYGGLSVRVQADMSSKYSDLSFIGSGGVMDYGPEAVGTLLY